MAAIIEVFVKSTPCPCMTQLPDAEAIRFDEDIAKLRARHGNAFVCRIHSLSANLNAFRDNEIMRTLLKTEGHDALPVTIADGEVILKGHYPDMEVLNEVITNSR